MNIKLLFILLVLIYLLGCTQKMKEFYFYDKENVFSTTNWETAILYEIRKEKYSSGYDSNKEVISFKGYQLLHYIKNDNNNPLDTFFIKHKSFLNSIDYFDSKWLKDEDNLNEFWSESNYQDGRLVDSKRIFIITPKMGTDSLVIRRVHRFIMPGLEGE